MKIKTIAAALAALCAIVGCGNRKCRENVFSAVKDGRAAADIVLPAKAHDIERYAAKELAYHIAEASGKPKLFFKLGHYLLAFNDSVTHALARYARNFGNFRK